MTQVAQFAEQGTIDLVAALPLVELGHDLLAD